MTRGLRRRVTLDGVKPVMNVTPLVDVVLVLLIIFMVVVPQLDQEVALELPGIFNVDPAAKTAETFKVSFPKAGEYHFDGNRYELDSLVTRLEAEHAAEPLRRLVLRADSALRYADVRELQRRLQEIGFPGMSFVVTQRHRWEEAAAPAADAERS